MTPAASGVVTLLTDFGLTDPYVGIMKGVILSLNRAASIIDVCHGVPPQNVELGALWLSHSFRWFPRGSVHVAVVDPGVGSARAALAATADGHFFVAPDNGLLSSVEAQSSAFEARRIDLERLGLATPSRTFHGRDVFARVAALLSSGEKGLIELGAPHALTKLDAAAPADDGSTATGRVLAVDHFGNLITNLPGTWLQRPGAELEIGRQRLRVVGTYSDAREGECVALASSFGLVEVAARNADASALLGLRASAPLVLRSEGARV
jgi:S-adenosylmethionine hydrolase